MEREQASEQWPSHLPPLHLRILTSVYRLSFGLMIDDPLWLEPLIESAAPRSGDRILHFGAGSAGRALLLAIRYPEASFAIVDSDRRSLSRVRRQIVAKKARNVELAELDRERLPFGNAVFDKVVSSLSFHQIDGARKIETAREMIRVLRRGGTLHVADFDQARSQRERVVLNLAKYIYGESSIQTHMDGSWPEALSKAGFMSIKRLSSHSVNVGRVSVLRARKRPG